MNVAPMIASQMAMENAVRTAQLAATNSARMAEYRADDGEAATTDTEEAEDTALCIDGPTFAAIVTVAVFAIAFAAWVLLS